jgi:hypothetical protein
MSSNIPSEYLTGAWDFGFSAVSDPDASEPPPPSPAPEAITAPVLDKITILESKIDDLLNMVERIEQAATPELDTEEYKGLIQKDVEEKLKKVEAMVMPLLMNLLKDAETKEYIRWPNRKVTIETFIEKFLAITRS